MGVPSFYRWLANSYPKTVVNAVEKTEEQSSNFNDPNPNGIEFDNLYLDMNGIIHPCFHPQQQDRDVKGPARFDEVFENTVEYIDRIMNIVRPRKLLYMAIDGVAPRAKMNQQRTRRFRTAKDRQILEEEEDRLRKQYDLEGKVVLPKEESEVADSNIITPGTEFMYELSKQLQVYIRLRIAKHPAWRSLRVILSDASSPGEGEHKIMSFIRRQRTCKGYDPNTSHVLYGLDADLIMLALATHEIHFSILRENVLAEHTQTVKPKGGWEDTVQRMGNLEISTSRKSMTKKPYQFLHVWILREYLKLDLNMTETPAKSVPDIERLIDDFIFICFFAGNDFLPHMPTLEIHEGAIDLLIHVYKDEFEKLGGYLVDVQRINDKKGGYIKLKRVEKFILAVGAYEDKIFKKRSEIHERKLRRALSDRHAAEPQEEDDLFPDIRCATNLPCNSTSLDHDAQIVENTKTLKEQLKLYTRDTSDVFKNGLVTDLVKYGSPGYKQRYYKCKFSVETEAEIDKMRKNLVEEYTKGLCWVLQYYFSDVPSWSWFYPYHYGPFASDLKGLASIKTTFRKGQPFKPFDQLMAVLPPTSAHALPESYQQLMTDETSNILDFYPSDFATDMDGKRFLWQGICKLPFIDEERLLSATKKIENELSDEEAKRNGENADKLFMHSSENLASKIISSFNDQQEKSIKIDTDLSGGDINGFVQPNHDSMKDPNVLYVDYGLPCFVAHIPRVLDGTTIPESVVCEADIEERDLWHEIHNEGSNRNPGVGFATRGGWSCRGRGSHDVAGNRHDQDRNPGVGFVTRGGWRGRGSHHDVAGNGHDQDGNPGVGFVARGGWRGRGSHHDVAGNRHDQDGNPGVSFVTRGGWRGRGSHHDVAGNRHDQDRNPGVGFVTRGGWRGRGSQHDVSRNQHDHVRNSGVGFVGRGLHHDAALNQFDQVRNAGVGFVGRGSHHDDARNQFDQGRNPGVGFVTRGGWNPRGRGSPHDASRNQFDQARGRSWNSTGRGTMTSNHPARADGKFWSVKPTESGSSSSESWGETWSGYGHNGGRW